MLLRIALAIGLAQVCSGPALAGNVEDLSRLLRLAEVMQVMRDEGLSYGSDLEGELFPEAGGARWASTVGTIYDSAQMLQQFEQVFAPEMAADPQALAATLDFFGSDQGQRIVELEIAARRALLDDAIEEVAKTRVDEMRRDQDPRLGLILRYAEVNDLIERNVAGALNSNLAFYRGMVAGGAFDGGLSEAEMLADVWSREAEVRDDTEEWLLSFLAMAYDPLSDDDLQAYVAFSETPPGQTLNTALFAGFDALFGTLSRDLGQAAAQMMSGQDL